MEIQLKRNYGYTLIITADNVKIEEDVEERIYQKGNNGKTDYSIPPIIDVSADAINKIVNVLSDMIYYRSNDIDTIALIELLFEKLSLDEVEVMLKKLNEKYLLSE